MLERIKGQITELDNMPLEKLKELYKYLYGSDAPKFANTDFVKPKVAYRIQELAFGGLSKKAINTISGINNGRLRIKPSHLEKINILPGSNIVKNWNGNIYRVRVTEKGFSLDGMLFLSLSGVAKYITGTNWNGYRFFDIKGGDND